MKGANSTTLLLVRHGQTDWNTVGRVQGWSDIPLNDVGRKQAERLACRLKAVSIDAVYSSDLQRAAETAEIVKGQRALPLRLCKELREIRYGEWEGKTRAQLERDGKTEMLRRWNEGKSVSPPSGGETREQVAARADQFLACVVPRHAGETVLIVSHGGTLRLMLCLLLGLPVAKWGLLRQGNTALSKAVLVPENPPRMEFMNDTAHLRGTGLQSLMGTLQSMAPRGAG